MNLWHQSCLAILNVGVVLPVVVQVRTISQLDSRQRPHTDGRQAAQSGLPGAQRASAAPVA